MVRHLLVNTAVALLVFALLSAPTAQSRQLDPEVYERGTLREPFSFEDDDCGFPVQVEGELNERYEILAVPGSSGQAFLERRRYSYRKVITNPATGKTMSVSGRGYFREVRATHVEGDVWELLAVETGRPFVVRDATGRVVLADRGVMLTLSVQDTLGDGRPSSQELEHEVANTLGTFPSLADDFDYCALVSRLIG
jgi:hypothetical protein